jgi:hypothetical protein
MPWEVRMTFGVVKKLRAAAVLSALVFALAGAAGAYATPNAQQQTVSGTVVGMDTTPDQPLVLVNTGSQDVLLRFPSQDAVAAIALSDSITVKAVPAPDGILDVVDAGGSRPQVTPAETQAATPADLAGDDDDDDDDDDTDNDNFLDDNENSENDNDEDSDNDDGDDDDDDDDDGDDDDDDDDDDDGDDDDDDDDGDDDDD